MDDVRDLAEEERHPGLLDHLHNVGFQHPRVRDLIATVRVKKMAPEIQRRVADATFRFLFQLDLDSVSSGIGNRELYNPAYSEASWRRPSFWLKHSVLAQYQIICSRIALECFFDLLYLIDTGERAMGKSKFRAVRKWITRPGNAFAYFVIHVVNAFEFERKHRQAEVHGTSRFPRFILCLSKPDTQDLNLQHKLTNILLNIWGPLIEIANEQKPKQIATFGDNDSEQFAKLYFLDDDQSFRDFAERLLESRLRNPPREPVEPPLTIDAPRPNRARSPAPAAAWPRRFLRLAPCRRAHRLYRRPAARRS